MTNTFHKKLTRDFATLYGPHTTDRDSKSGHLHNLCSLRNEVYDKYIL